ncbi:hypothetical protein [Nocardia caishijiensis]|uniref:PPE family protein n=1 Tax=Nocardia caishijiensis TaxID=184756 RepID=A0ABQ6YTU2_9NOCA|nr:hypothetical protein [Nocardia caishijiensis]KAF0849225.1 hypothetical protein FNL39_101662 [Nocardia caishijiensis]
MTGMQSINGLDLLGNLRELVSFSGDDGELDSSEIADIQDQYNDQRAVARQQASQLGFDGEYRPQTVAKNNLFAGSVAELRAKVDKIDLDAVNDLIGAWTEISSRNSTSLDEFRKQIAHGMSPDVWAGSAATAAAQTVAAYDTTGKRVSTAAALTSNKLVELRTGLEPTKRLVPHQPEHRSGVDNFAGLFAGRSWRNDDVAEENARVEAVRVLQTVYAPVIYESDTNVPVIPVPKTVDNPGGVPEIPGGGGSGPGVGGSPGSQLAAAPSTPSAVTPTTDPGESPAEEPSPDDDQNSSDDDTPQTTDPSSTTPAATTPAATAPQSTTPGTPGGTGVPSGGAPGSGVPGAGAPGSSSPGAGAALPGGAASAAAGANRGGSAGTAARSGMPGMMSPGAGRGGGKDDESTKGVPDYLVTQENGEELTGLDSLPKMVPPVIGAD